MGAWRMMLLGCGWMLAGHCAAQAVMHKHLIIALGGGGGYTTIESNSGELRANGLLSSAVRFTFAYAISDRISLGGHYDRVGSVVHPGVDRTRTTTYLIETTYRPWIKENAALEFALGIGGAITVIRPPDLLIPFECRAPAFNAGVRYLHLFTSTVGLQIALDHAQAFEREITFADERVPDPSEHITLSWHAQRITAGMFVRF